MENRWMPQLFENYCRKTSRGEIPTKEEVEYFKNWELEQAKSRSEYIKQNIRVK